jgi:hypothetical protein
VSTTTACDLCGTAGRVKAPFLDLWNGNSLDLCIPCAADTGLVALLDKLIADRDRKQNLAPHPASAKGG